MRGLLFAAAAGLGLLVAAPLVASAREPAPAAGASTTGIIDINSASAAELDALPGIGTARAAAIVKGRPYKNKYELVTKKIVPESVYGKIKDRLVAHGKS